MADVQVTLVGNIGTEPVTRTTTKGEVLDFSVAVNERTRGPDGQWTDGNTSWFKVSAWGQLGRNAASCLHRGQPVVVHGTIRITESGRDGQRTKFTGVRASAIGHDLALGTGTFVRGGGQGDRQPSPSASQPEAPPAEAAAQASAPEPTPDSPPAREPALAGWGTSFGADEDAPF